MQELLDLALAGYTESRWPTPEVGLTQRSVGA